MIFEGLSQKIVADKCEDLHNLLQRCILYIRIEAYVFGLR